MTLGAKEKQHMLEAETLNARLESMERRLAELSRQRAGITEEIGVMDAIERVTPGTQFFAPVANGIFAPAMIQDTATLLVNVGADVVLPRTPEWVREKLRAQLTALQAEEERLQEEFDAGVRRLEQIQSEFAPKHA